MELAVTTTNQKTLGHVYLPTRSTEPSRPCATRTTRTSNCVSRPTFPCLAFTLIEEAEKTCHRVEGPEQSKPSLEGIAFMDGEPVQGDRQGQHKLIP
jgi:hypothetical protein